MVGFMELVADMEEEMVGAGSSPEHEEAAANQGQVGDAMMGTEAEEGREAAEEEVEPTPRRKGKEHSRHRSGSRKRGATDEPSDASPSVKRKTSSSEATSQIQFPVGMSYFSRDFAYHLRELCQTTSDGLHWEDMELRKLGPSLVSQTAFLLGGIHKLTLEFEAAQRKAVFAGEETTRANMAIASLKQAEVEIAGLKSKLAEKDQELEVARKAREQVETGKAKSDEAFNDAALSLTITIGDYRAVIRKKCEEHHPGLDFRFIKDVKASSLQKGVEEKLAVKKKELAQKAVAKAVKKAAEEAAQAMARLGDTAHQGEEITPQDPAQAGLPSFLFSTLQPIIKEEVMIWVMLQRLDLLLLLFCLLFFL